MILKPALCEADEKDSDDNLFADLDGAELRIWKIDKSLSKARSFKTTRESSPRASNNLTSLQMIRECE